MIHNVSYRTFVYGTENEEKVKKAVKTLFPTPHPKWNTLKATGKIQY